MATIVTRTDKIVIACTWGDGPDVLMDISSGGAIIPLDLTAKDARAIAQALNQAADQSDELDALAAKE